MLNNMLHNNCIVGTTLHHFTSEKARPGEQEQDRNPGLMARGLDATFKGVLLIWGGRHTRSRLPMPFSKHSPLFLLNHKPYVKKLPKVKPPKSDVVLVA